MTANPFEPAPAVDVIWRHADLRPDADAVVDPHVSLTFEQLRDEIAQLAKDLRAIGVCAGQPVLVLLDVCAESVVAYWALRAINAVVVVGDPTAKAAELQYCLDVTNARHVLAGTRAAASMSAPPEVAWHTLPERARSGMRRWRLAQNEPAAVPKPEFEPGRAVILFSSGTTGRPKAIVHTETSVRGLHETLLKTWQLVPEDRVLGVLPFHTIYGLLFSAGSTVYAGATLVLLDRFNAERTLAAIERHRITTAAFVPTVLLRILNCDDRDGFDLTSLRAVYTASAPISDSDIERFRAFSGASVIANYGMTEIPGAAVEPADEPHRTGSVGRISPGFEVCVRDSDGRPLPVGETGEITMRGPSQMHEYLGAPDLTAERVRDGWVYSQDIGRSDAEGNIYLSGRTSDMIIRGGLNISPLEVEHALSSHPGILEVAVVGTPDDEYGQVVTAFVVASSSIDEGLSVEARKAELKGHCRSLLSPAKVPAHFVFLDELPRNAGGKVLRKSLQERFAATADTKGIADV